MKVNGDNAPEKPFTLEQIPNHPGYVLARFYENAKPYTKTRDDMTISGYEYDEYHLTLLQTATLEEDIEAQYGTYLEQARLNELQQAPFDPLDYRRRVAELSRNAANLDYVAMMTGIELPEEGGQGDGT